MTTVGFVTFATFVTSDITKTESELHVAVDLRVMTILKLALKTILYYYCLVVYNVEYEINPCSARTNQ